MSRLAAGSLALALLAAAPSAHGASTRDYSVPEVMRAFRTATGLPLVRFREASTADVTSLRSRPHETRRFGEFQIFVFRPGASSRMHRVFTQGERKDRQGIYWVPDHTGGWIAVTRHGRNLAVAWFPTPRGHYVDARWRRLQAVVRRFG